MDTPNTHPTWRPLPGHPGLGFHSLPALPEAGFPDVGRLPV